MKLGHITPTINKKHTFNEKEFYQSVYCKRGRAIDVMQFTDDELTRATLRGQRNIEDIPQLDVEVKGIDSIYYNIFGIILILGTVAGFILGAVIW